MTFLGFVLLSVVLHVLVGWPWTIAAGLAYGLTGRRLAWLGSAGAVAGGWAVLVFYTLVVAPAETGRMMQTVGGILGNMPGWVVVAATVLMGGLLGLLGGVTGTVIRGFTARRSGRTRSSSSPLDEMPDLEKLKAITGRE